MIHHTLFFSPNSYTEQVPQVQSKEDTGTTDTDMSVILVSLLLTLNWYL